MKPNIRRSSGNLLANLELRRELLFYGIAGVLNTAAFLLVVFLFITYITESAVISVSAGYVASVAVSFVVNSTLTFESGQVYSGLQASKFAMLCGIGYLYNVVVAGVGSDVFGVSFGLLVLIVAVTWPVFSFLASKYLVFR